MGLRVLLHNDQTDPLKAKLRAAYPDVLIETHNSYEGLAEKITTFRPDVVYAVRFAGSVGYPVKALMGKAGPSWIANGGAGTDHLGVWDPTRVRVSNAAGVAAEMMAEYVIGGFLHFSLDVPGLQADQRAGVWRSRVVSPLRGKTLLIVGLGHTGRAIAARAAAFGMIVLGTRRTPVATPGVEEVHGSDVLGALLPRADFVAVATPLTPETKGLIGKDEVAVMKAGAVFADVSRGGVTDQDALLEALQKGQLRGAALDVFEVEPLPGDSPFWALENVLISPHCSSVHDGWEADSFDLFLKNLGRFIAGKPLLNVVDPERGY